MKCILTVILVLFTVNVYGWGIPFIDLEKSEKPKEVVEKEEVVKHYSLWVYGGEQKVFYIYRHTKGGISQVGIIDEGEQRIYRIKNVKKIDWYKYLGESTRIEYIEQNFPNVETLEFYKK